MNVVRHVVVVASSVGVSGGGGVTPWQNLRLTSPSSGALISEWWFDEGSGTTVADQAGSNTINLATPTTPNATWSATGIDLAAGLVQTPSITGARTVALLVNIAKDDISGFAISGGSQSGTGLVANGATSAYTYHVGYGRGMVPLHGRVSGASLLGTYRIHRGNWYLVFCDFNAAYTTILGLGGRHSTTTSRCATAKIAWTGVYSGVLTDAERTQVYTMARALCKSRGVYLDYRDCPVQANTVAIWGQSNAEGRALISNLSGADQARTTPANCFISRRDTSVTAQLVMGTNQTTTNIATQFGPEMPIAWAAETAGKRLYISKCGIGSSYLYNTAGADWGVDELPTSGHFHPTAMRQLWQMEADMLNAGVGPVFKGLCWMQGEQDATDATYGAAYQANLEALTAKFREQVGDATAKVVLARIRDQDPTFDAGAVANVRAAVQTIATAQTNTEWFDTDSMALQGDNVHYDAAGMKLLGQAFYDRTVA